MKYMLLMNGTTHGVEGYRAWSESDIQRHFAELAHINACLKEAGEFVATEGLAFPTEAKLVIASSDGLPQTDGVFPESKEFLLGYWIVDVDSVERAFEIALEISAAPGPGGVPTQVPIEVRRIMSVKDQPH